MGDIGNAAIVALREQTISKEAHADLEREIEAVEFVRKNFYPDLTWYEMYDMLHPICNRW